MTDILLATDADWVAEEIEAALAGVHTVHRVRSGTEVVPAIAELDPGLVVLDLQIGNMGGIATCLAIRQEEGARRIRTRPVLLLLDRAVDEFLARRAGADGWLVKPLDAFGVARAVERVLEGETAAETLV